MSREFSLEIPRNLQTFLNCCREFYSIFVYKFLNPKMDIHRLNHPTHLLDHASFTNKFSQNTFKMNEYVLLFKIIATESWFMSESG